uniref:Cadherin N-terminal domain-containing protein n=2 Tax=Oreochromis aureus TaxID=47969 RepID=A0AAZ1WWS1_OREAU
MENEKRSRGRNGVWFILHVALLLFVGKGASVEIRYSVAEEVKDGTVVGSVAKDLGLDISSLTSRRFRVVSESKDAFFD